MATIDVKCPYCQKTNVCKNGKCKNGEQRYLCKNPFCSTKTFRLNYTYVGCTPGIERKIISLAINGSGIRDTSRVEHVSTNKVMSTLKKLKLS